MAAIADVDLLYKITRQWKSTSRPKRFLVRFENLKSEVQKIGRQVGFAIKPLSWTVHSFKPWVSVSCFLRQKIKVWDTMPWPIRKFKCTHDVWTFEGWLIQSFSRPLSQEYCTAWISRSNSPTKNNPLLVGINFVLMYGFANDTYGGRCSFNNHVSPINPLSPNIHM